MKTSTSLTIAAMTFSLCLTVRAQDFSAVQIETIPVTDGIFMLVGQGGNIGLSVGDDGAMIVDSQYGPLTDKIQAAVTAAGGGDITLVVNTHWHGDHTGGNVNFGNAGALIMAHENVRVRLAAADNAQAAGFPKVTYPDRAGLYWNGNNVNLIRVQPAHTDGDSIVHFTNRNAFHLGDTFPNGTYPFIDVNSAGSFDGIIAAGELVISLADENTMIIPGHGPLADKADLEAWIGIMKTIRGRLQSLIDDGLSADEVVAAGVTSDWDATMGAGFMNPENFTRLAYQSMTE